MRYEIEQYEHLKNHPYADVAIMSDILAQVKKYSEKAGYNRCVLVGMNDYSINDQGRIDLEVVHNDMVWQKLFYMDGEVIDCNAYMEKYLMKRRTAV